MLTRFDQLDSLQAMLEQQFEQVTDELTMLTLHATTPERIGFDQHGIATQIASVRQKLAETTQALQRVVRGTYGRCERCEAEIPLERLEIRPHARHCVPCQQDA